MKSRWYHTRYSLFSVADVEMVSLFTTSKLHLAFIYVIRAVELISVHVWTQGSGHTLLALVTMKIIHVIIIIIVEIS